MKRLIFALLVFCLASPLYAASVTLAWDNGQMAAGQDLQGTEVLIDGLPIGVAEGENNTYLVDLDEFAYNPGDQITFSARHLVLENGINRTGPESEGLAFVVPAPIAAPSLRIQIIID